MSDTRGDSGGYLGWFLLGGLVGAGLALIMTPRTGQETRELLSEKGAEWSKRAQELAGDLQVRAGDFLAKGRDLVEEQTRRLASAFEAGREAMREEIAQGRQEG